MHKRYKTLIEQAQQGDKKVLEEIINENKRINLEYSEKIFGKRI